MKVNKFKKLTGGKYKVYFETCEMTLYEEVILKYELLYSKDIDIYKLDEISKENKYYEAYHMALKYIEIKLRSKSEIEEYLSKKDFDNATINKVIEDINKLGLLNDEVYVQSYINDKVNLSNNGPYKIKNELLKLDFDEAIIDTYLSKIDYQIWKEKLTKYINKKKNQTNNKSYYMFINKLKNDLINLGYEKDMIDEELSKIEYFKGNINKEYDKLMKKYKDKNKTINALLRKGYSYDEISVLKSDNEF